MLLLSLLLWGDSTVLLIELGLLLVEVSALRRATLPVCAAGDGEGHTGRAGEAAAASESAVVAKCRTKENISASGRILSIVQCDRAETYQGILGIVQSNVDPERISSVADPGGEGHGRPGPVKISHKKDDCQRRPNRFHVSRPPPLT